MLHHAGAGALLLVGLMLMVLHWQQADDLALRFGAHCTTDAGEPFVRVHQVGATDSPTYDVIETTGETDCTVQDTSGWHSDDEAVTLRGTEIGVTAGSGSGWHLSDTEWQQPPMFVSTLSDNAPMRWFFDRGPKLFYGFLLFGAVGAAIGRHLYYSR